MCSEERLKTAGKCVWLICYMDKKLNYSTVQQ